MFLWQNLTQQAVFFGQRELMVQTMMKRQVLPSITMEISMSRDTFSELVLHSHQQRLIPWAVPTFFWLNTILLVLYCG